MTVALLMDFDPWRDLTPEQWREQGLTRPKRRPPPEREFPGLTPPLGVWLVDWAFSGQEDEPLPRGVPPWALPATVRRAGTPDAAALAALRKRREYLPADWQNEQDDRTAAGGVLAVTFEDLPPNLPPGPLVLFARLNRPAGVLLDGEADVAQLGVSARIPPEHTRPRRGWHTYQLTSGQPRPDTPCTVTVDLAGARCSQLLLSLTTGDVPRPRPR